MNSFSSALLVGLHVEEGGRRRKEEKGGLLSNSLDRSSFQSYLSFINPLIWVSTVPWCKRWINKQTYKHKKKVDLSWDYLDKYYKSFVSYLPYFSVPKISVRMAEVAKALVSWASRLGSNPGWCNWHLLTFYANFSKIFDFWPQILQCPRGRILEIFKYVNKLTKNFNISQKKSLRLKVGPGQ